MFLRPAAGWPSPHPEVRWGVGSAILCLLGAQIAGIFWFAAAAAAVYGSETIPDDAPIWTRLVFNLGLWAAYFVGPLIVLRRTGSDDADFDLSIGGPELAASAVVGVLTQIAVLPVLYIGVERLLDGDPAGTAEALIDRVDGPLDVALLVATVVLIGPVVEEWFYRGMLLPTLTRRFGPTVGVLGSSALFALVHQEVILLPGLFVFGLILAWLTVTTSRLGPAIVAHMAFNAATVVLLLT